MGNLTDMEIRFAQCGLVDEYRYAVRFELLHNVLDGGLTEIIGTGLHGQSVDTDDRVLNIPDKFHHLRGYEFLAGTICVYNGLDEVLRNLTVIGSQLFGILR